MSRDLVSVFTASGPPILKGVASHDSQPHRGPPLVSPTDSERSTDQERASYPRQDTRPLEMVSSLAKMRDLLLAIGVFTLGARLAIAQQCYQYGISQSDSCLCPPGFNPSDSEKNCNLPACGGNLYQPGSAAPGGYGGFGNTTLGSCSCSDGFTGPACTGETSIMLLKIRY